MFEEFHLLRPWWLLGLAPVLILTVLWARRRLTGSHWRQRIAPALLDVLLDAGGERRGQRLAWWVAGGLALMTLGLAGPTWERLPQPVERRSDALVILLDLSLSMFAEDVAPSRLTRARQKITDVLRLRDEGFTALVAFAGDAHTVSPLTDDTATINNLLSALSPEMMPVLGSSPEAAVQLARELFDNAGMRQGRLLLITDGVDDPAALRERRSPNYPLSVLGVGTEAGGRIPLDFVNQPGQVLRNQQGEAIVARLDERRLAQVVEDGYGRYRRLTLGDEDIAALLATPLPGAEDSAAVERDFDRWVDRGYWVAVALLPLALLGFRRGVLAMVVVLVLPLPAQAGWWQDLWQRPDQQGRQALREGSPETAMALFDDDRWRAVAEYRGGEFDAAQRSFETMAGADGHYNRGNALAKSGALEAAVAAYDRALALQPDHADAAFNRQLVQDLLDAERPEDDSQARDPQSGGQPEQQPSQQPGGQPQPSEDPLNGEQPEQAPPQQTPAGEEPEAEPGDRASAENEDEPSRDEEQDALEQWLRRVPDDPGGLLRRKFQYETNQRLREGDYRYREREKIW